MTSDGAMDSRGKERKGGGFCVYWFGVFGWFIWRGMMILRPLLLLFEYPHHVVLTY
jgi:hypothetical protein